MFCEALWNGCHGYPVWTGSTYRQQNRKWQMQYFTFQKFLFLSSAHRLMDCCVKNAKDQDPKNRSAGRCCGPHLRRCLLRVPQWLEWCFPPHFGFCCFSLKRWPILSRMGDQRRLPHWSYEARVFQAPRISPDVAMKANTAWKNSFFCSCSAYRVHDPAV